MNATSTLLILSLLGAPPAASTDPLCAKREPCRVVETRDAGQDEQGHPLQVKRLSLGWTSLETAARFTGRQFGPEGRKDPGPKKVKGQCEATEWWLVRPEQPAQLLLSVCNDGQGAVREEKLAVSNNRVRYMQSGERRGTRFTTTRVLQLSPLRLMSDNNESTRVSPSGQEREDGEFWDYAALRGEVVRAPSECRPGQSSLGERTLPYLPQVKVDEAYLQGGWKQTGLGSGEGECHLGANAILLGKEQLGNQQDASLKALLVAEDTLIVEVLDDKWTGPSATWLNDDHVELWLAPMAPHQLTGCGAPTEAQKPMQWSIRIADGKVFPAFGAPKETLGVERAVLPGGNGYRLKVKLPTLPFLGIGLVYSDSDSGKKPESRVATSELKPGRPETLNPVYLVYPEEATCAVREGQLTVVQGELQVEPAQAALQKK
ncbi:hypothetical protein [Archangium lipolyticum]|uniref:hypothetical protein n=1 Tax=Archangium lipolyticum TaxID=2970465 RepID=UPI00214A30F7|nr:hypothetical protein [Archangium lipolyticum]